MTLSWGVNGNWDSRGQELAAQGNFFLHPKHSELFLFLSHSQLSVWLWKRIVKLSQNKNISLLGGTRSPESFLSCDKVRASQLSTHNSVKSSSRGPWKGPGCSCHLKHVDLMLWFWNPSHAPCRGLGGCIPTLGTKGHRHPGTWKMHFPWNCDIHGATGKNEEKGFR